MRHADRHVSDNPGEWPCSANAKHQSACDLPQSTLHDQQKNVADRSAHRYAAGILETSIALMAAGKVGEFFGIPAATDASTGIVAGVNRDNEVLLVDERTGKEMRRFTLASPCVWRASWAARKKHCCC
jgi:hypothetical protein